MKHIATAAALLALAAGTASAQSSVTLFGVVDTNIRNVSNSGVASNTTLSNSGLSSGRFGFRGVEDLGGGLKAGFWLESDLNIDTGTTNANGKLFARRSTVSLMGNFGEVRLGRDLTPSGAHTYLYDPFGVIGLGGSANVARYAAQTTFFRSDNAVSYFTPNLSGFQGQIMVAPDESGVNNVNRYSGTRLSYAAGPVSVSGSYGTTNVVGGKFTTSGIAGSYNFGVATLMGHYYSDRLLTLKENRFLLGVTVPLGAHQIRASYLRSDATGGTAAYNASDANMLALGYVHNLSKRTALYATTSRISNKGGATFALAGGTPGITAGGTSSGYEFGMRHNF
ncbi:MAG: porin [Polaromonas sp.]|uniref:porin n=1 Tax=Polaromonas sp. TaxID=1869339 RepID=UPI0027360681|nr:porin [Polaromonas sp.]MDP2818889.1 porin [Polaromonas sp.]